MQSKASSIASETQPWPDWRGQTAVCIATGPSLTKAAVLHVRSRAVRVIGINDIGLTEDWIDVWYAADFKFWKHYRIQAEQSKALKVCAEDEDEIIDSYVNVLNRAKAEAFVPGYSHNGGHSGLQALSMAISFGATRIFLLGYDCRKYGQKTNFFGTKCQSLHKDSPYDQWPEHYRRLKLPEGVTVLNATPGSAIDAFPMVSIDAL